MSTTGEYFTDSKSKGEIVIFTTTKGICSGGSGGNFINQSLFQVSIPEATNGCALIKDNDGWRQYVVSLNETTEYNPYDPPTLAINTEYVS